MMQLQLSQLPVATDIPCEWLSLFALVDAAAAGELWPAQLQAPAAP